MKKDNRVLQMKILSSYAILLIVIGCMIIVLLHEHQRMKEIETDSANIWGIRQKIEVAHRYIIELATRGESAISWENADYEAYRDCRLRTDSLLVTLQGYCTNFVRPGQLDTLRNLLSDKETHLIRIRQAFKMQKEADSLLANRLPIITRQTTHSEEVVKRKKGLAGWFGKKETVKSTKPVQQLHKLNEQLIGMQQEHTHNLEVSTDSLSQKNKELNGKLMELIGRLDEQAKVAFQYRGQRMAEVRKDSFQLLSSVIAVAIVLLLISFALILRDIKQMEKITKQHQKMLEMRKNIILTLSHDIRGPLNTIGGNAELAMDTREKKKRNIYLNKIRVLCKHILNLLNNLLDVYRLNEAREITNNVPFYLSDLLERIASDFKQPINNKGLLFVYESKGTEANVLGDVDRIEQIINNLLTNAIKFTNAGTIRLMAVYKKQTLSLEVSDTGIGMNEEQLSKIFHPFERGTAAIHVEGFGLGLPITKGLVKLLGGTLSVTSKSGKGSIFVVHLPLPLTTQMPKEEPSTFRHSLRLPGHVLLIDDDPMQLEMVKEMLERNGISCQACRDIKEVVKEMRKSDFDMLITDIQMEGTNGFELLKLMRCSTIGNSLTIPIIAMTARGDQDKEVFLKAGFDTCIYKPFSMNELLASLSSLMETKEEKAVIADFSTLTEEVENKGKMLYMFINESSNSVAELEKFLETGDRVRMREIIHRIVPMLELIQADGPLRAYRAFFNKKDIKEETIKEQTRQIIDYIKMLREKALTEMKKVKDEQENTNSRR